MIIIFMLKKKFNFEIFYNFMQFSMEVFLNINNFIKLT